MQGQSSAARGVSAALFNNAAFTEVLSSAHTLLAAGTGEVTTRQVAAAIGRSDSVVRPVMIRLVGAGLLVDPGPGTSWGPHPFTRGQPELWRALIGVVGAISGAPIALLDVAPSDADQTRREP